MKIKCYAGLIDNFWEMNMKQYLLCLLVLVATAAMSIPAQARTHSIYVNPFTISGGIPASDPVDREIKEFFIEVIADNDKFDILEDEAKMMARSQTDIAYNFGNCTDDGCMKALIEGMDIDYIVYGYVKRINGIYYITVKMLSNEDEAARIVRIKTVRFAKRDCLEKASRVLAGYVITGDPDDADEFLEDMFDAEERERELSKASSIEKTDREYSQSTENWIRNVEDRRRNTMMSYYSTMRFGYGGLGLVRGLGDVYKYYRSGTMYTLDFIKPGIWGDSYRTGARGWDLYFRFLYKHFLMPESSVPPVEEAELNRDPVSPGELKIWGGDIGLRYRWSIYFLNNHFDLYCAGALRNLYISEKADDVFSGGTLENKGYDIGVYTGAGIEVGMFLNIGFFAEYNIGISACNSDGHQVIFGVCWRGK